VQLDDVERMVKQQLQRVTKDAADKEAGVAEQEGDLANLAMKIEKKTAELERNQKRLVSLQSVRPHYMDEYDGLEETLSNLYKDYLVRFRNLEYLEHELDTLNQAEYDKMEKARRDLEQLRKKVEQDEKKMMLNSDDDDALEKAMFATRLTPREGSGRSGRGGGGGGGGGGANGFSSDEDIGAGFSSNSNSRNGSAKNAAAGYALKRNNQNFNAGNQAASRSSKPGVPFYAEGIERATAGPLVSGSMNPGAGDSDSGDGSLFDGGDDDSGEISMGSNGDLGDTGPRGGGGGGGGGHGGGHGGGGRGLGAMMHGDEDDMDDDQDDMGRELGDDNQSDDSVF
jgi:hypothetical protein